ncbi:MAG: 16S rRNA (adenine(1518)-N(6)/adenine(1519)-N(6))-dimethyltransferase RsmA [Lysobacterales bacterium]|jgi:16S rRNA (adenine1518-N6/adenine1519-N6)-dimethyltransferase
MQHRPRKRFGQNFLRDRRVIDRIIDSIAPAPADLLLEIGPGRGALTEPLLASGAELHVIEIDRDLVAALRQRFDEGRLHIHNRDALKSDLASIAGLRPFRLVGNLPYNISTPLIFHCLRWSQQIRDMHFMLQKEVVDRLAAEPGSRTYGRLSVMARYRCRVAPLFEVMPESFAPAPKVSSVFLRLLPHDKPPFDAGAEGSLDRVVAAAFNQRRKTLRNALKTVLSAEQIQAAGVDPGQRAEQLHLAQFCALARLLSDGAD